MSPSSLDMDFSAELPEVSGLAASSMRSVRRAPLKLLALQGSNRHLIKAISVFLIHFLLSGCSCTKKESELPNVILVLVDDLGIGDIGTYGQKILTTPNLDRMASEGIHFENMYCGSTVCAPSRASLITGKHTGNSSVRGNLPQQLIGDSEYTIARAFKDAGYNTGSIGKWGAGRYMPLDDPQRKGFDYFYGYINMFHAHNFYPEYLYQNGEKVYLNNRTMLVDGVNPWAGDSVREGYGIADIRNEYTHYLFDSVALDFITKNREEKFFLYLAYTAPHVNNENKKNGLEVHSYHEYEDMDWPEQEKGFAAMIRNIDNSMGMLFDKLSELGIDDNTLVLFCSDNGPHAEGRHDFEFFDSNGSFRGRKRDLYEGGIKSPFIARWPLQINPGTSSDDRFAFWDFLATFADLTRVKPTNPIDGISFLPTLLGEEQKQQHEYLYWEFYEGNGKQALIKDNWKAIRLNVSKGEENTRFELYNLIDDPSETRNVAKDHPGLKKEFEELFITARTEFEVTPLFMNE